MVSKSVNFGVGACTKGEYLNLCVLLLLSLWMIYHLFAGLVFCKIISQNFMNEAWHSHRRGRKLENAAVEQICQDIAHLRLNQVLHTTGV